MRRLILASQNYAPLVNFTVIAGTAIKDKVPIEDVRGLVCVCANVTKKKIG